MLSTRWVGVLALFLAASAHADFYLHHWEDHYEPVHQVSLEPTLLYYSATQNFDQNAVQVTPPGLGSYKRLEIDLTGQFGLLDRFSIFARLAWARVAVNQFSATNTTYGFADQALGANFRVYETPLQRGQWTAHSLDLQFQTDFPLYNATDSNPSAPVLGDHSVDITPGGFGHAVVWQDSEEAAVFTAGTGYTFRTKGFSAQIPWTLAGSLEQKTAGLLLNAAIFGTASLNKQNPASPGTTSAGSGGSFITGGVNSETVILRGKVGYQFNPDSQLLLAYERGVWGQNAPVGNNVWLGYRATFGATGEESPFSKSNTGLQQYNLDAKVTKVNDRVNRVEIDKGFDEGVDKGQIFDLFTTSADGEALEAVARAQVNSVKSSEAALTVIEYFKEVYINPGLVAKRLVR